MRPSRPPTAAHPQRTEHGMVDYEGLIVPYRIVRSARRRRTIEMRVEPDGVRVAAPQQTSTTEVETFIRSRIAWIRKQRETLQSPAPRTNLEAAEMAPYQGRLLPIEVTATSAKSARVDLDLLGIRISVPTRTPEDGRASVAAAALRDWYRQRALEEIPIRVAFWATQAGYAPSRVLVRDQKRRWGSCAPDGTLRFNWRLVMLEPRLLDYVVVHELAHLVRPHHRPSFWAEVERIMPGARNLRSQLRTAGASLPMA